MMVHRSTDENTVTFLQTNVTDFTKPPNCSIPELASVFCTSRWFENLQNTQKLS